jgi:hypothetical protein
MDSVIKMQMEQNDLEISKPSHVKNKNKKFVSVQPSDHMLNKLIWIEGN